MFRYIALRSARHFSTSSNQFSTDILVLGSGVAGSSAALTLAQQGLNVTMLSAAQDPHHCNSHWAQGGIIYKGTDDTPQRLAQDIHYAGAGICNAEAVMHLATRGPKSVEDLLINGEYKVPFDRDAQSGELALCLEASHNCARIVHWRDQTGRAITETLLQAVHANPRINILPSRTALDLLTTPASPFKPSHCIGALIMNENTNAAEEMYASQTILATGGLGEIYQHTSNHPSARGDGMAMAYRAGASLKSMEYVQFHPTTFFFEGERSFLLTEALRGEGARLLNHQGHYFAKDYHTLGELAPRDVVSRMIMSEMKDSGEKHMWLDISHRDAEWLRGRFPSIYEHCLRRGFDMTKVPVPIVPAAHYFCGGVEVDLDGRTSVPGLYAAGEVSCTGLHGANRLASTSLLEGLVWGQSIGQHIATLPRHELAAPKNFFIPRLLNDEPPPSSELINSYWDVIKEVMWNKVGVTRTAQGLQEAGRTLRTLESTVSRMRQKYPLNIEVTTLLNGVQCALLVTHAANRNKESRGTHFVLPGQSYTPAEDSAEELQPTVVSIRADALAPDTHSDVR